MIRNLSSATSILLLAFMVMGSSLKAQNQLSMQPVQTKPFTLPHPLYQAATRTPDGDLFFLSSEGQAVYRLPGTSMSVNSIPLDLSESFQNLKIFADIDVDANGNIYTVGQWRGNDKKDIHFAVFVHDKSGSQKRVVELKPLVVARRLALDTEGNLYVLGYDPGYFKHERESCMLVHKYAPDGARLTSFSECPSDLALRRPGDIRPASDFRRLADELDRGHLWISDGVLYHVLPISRRMRVLDLNGRLIKEVLFTPPTAAQLLRSYGQQDLTASGERIWWIIPLPESRFLIQWLHSEHRGSAHHNFPYLAVHDADGQPVSQPATLPFKRSFPLASENGNVIFIKRVADAQHERALLAIDLKGSVP